MRILLTKLSDAKHVVEIRWDPRETESVELESRSFLLHDLAHYAVEAEAGLTDGVYGQLARRVSMAELNVPGAAPATSGLTMAETLSASVQSLYRGRVGRDLYLEHDASAYPDGVNEDFIDRVLERLRRLEGHYKATRYREAMELTWPPPQADGPV